MLFSALLNIWRDSGVTRQALALGVLQSDFTKHYKRGKKRKNTKEVTFAGRIFSF